MAISNVTITDLTIAAATARKDPCIGPGDTINVTFTATNSTGVALASFRVLSITLNGAYIAVNGQTLAVTQKNNTTATYTCTAKAVAADEEIVDEGLQRTNLFGELVKHNRRCEVGKADLVIQWWSSSNAASKRMTVSNTLVFVDRRCKPGIKTFNMRRCDSLGELNDEGEKMLMDIALTFKDQKWLTRYNIRVDFYEEEYGDTVESIWYDYTKVYECLDNVQTILIDSDYVFEKGTQYIADLVFYENPVFYDGETYFPESDTESITVARAFANLHLSAKANGGAAFGRFSTSTDSQPKLESEYPLYLYDGIAYLDPKWETLTLVNGSSDDSIAGGGRPKICKIGNHVYISGGVNIGGGNTITNVGDTYKPLHEMSKFVTTTGNRIAKLVVDTNGDFKVEWVHNLTNGSNYGTDTWVNCNMDYWIFDAEG